jgi:hypothetical protein
MPTRRARPVIEAGIGHFSPGQATENVPKVRVNLTSSAKQRLQIAVPASTLFRAQRVDSLGVAGSEVGDLAQVFAGGDLGLLLRGAAGESRPENRRSGRQGP